MPPKRPAWSAAMCTAARCPTPRPAPPNPPPTPPDRPRWGASEVSGGALLAPRPGTIEPLGYARGLARAAIASGAAVYTQTAVTGARADGALWRLSTARG